MMKLNDIKDMLTDAHYLCIDKALIHNLGANGAIVYCELVTRGFNYEKRGMLDSDGYFFCTVNDIEFECSVTQRQQTPIFKDLVKRGLIAVAYRGLPKKRYIKVLCNAKAVERAFEDTREHAEKKPMPQEVKDKYSTGFDPEIMDKEIDSVAKEHGTDKETVEGVKRVYHKYIGFFGNPDTHFSRSSIGNIIENAPFLDSEYNIFDPEWFDSLLEEYQRENVEGAGYTRSINHMMTDEIISILFERAR